MFMFQLGSNIYPNLSLSTKSLSAPFDTVNIENVPTSDFIKYDLY